KAPLWISDLGNRRGLFKRRVKSAPLGGSLAEQQRRPVVGDQHRGSAPQQGCDERGGRGGRLGGGPGRQVATGAQRIVQFVPQVQKGFLHRARNSTGGAGRTGVRVL